MLYSAEISNFRFSTKVKLQSKLSDELGDSFSGAIDKGLGVFKLFHNSKVVNKDSFISSIYGANENMVLSAIAGLPQNKSVFKRFDRDNYNSYWSSNGRDVDAIAFIPNKSVIFWGFSLFSSHSEDKFETKYWIYVDNNLVESHDDTIAWTDYEDKFFFRIATKNLIDVKAGSKLEIVALVAKSFSGERSVYQYYGNEGDEFREVENENKGLWSVEYSLFNSTPNFEWEHNFNLLIC